MASSAIAGLVQRIGTIGWRGRAATAAIASGYFAALLARGGYDAWGHFGVWTLRPSFLDMRSVTSAWECARRGIAVLPVNPCDPLDRPANYPTVWLLPSHIGLGQSSTVPLAIATAAVFLVAALAVVPRRAGLLEGVVYGLALCSPSVMLGIERGNVDLLMFALVVLAVLLLRRDGAAAIASPLILLFAAILKLFPILAAPVLARLSSRRALLALAGVGVVFGVYALATLDTIREIRRVVPQSSAYSYGIKPFGVWASNLLGAYGLDISPTFCDVLAAGVIVAGAVFLWGRLRRRSESPQGNREAQRDLDFFVSGSAVYVATFCLFQNFEYRMVFLLLAVPQLCRWARARRATAIVGLSLLLLALWLGAPWAGVPVVSTLLHGWQWLTSRRPFVGVDQSLSAATSVQVTLALVLLALLLSQIPARSLRLRRIDDRSSTVDA